MNGPAPPAPRPPSQSRSHANHVKASCTSPFTMPPPPPSQQRNHGNRSRDRNNTKHGTSLNNRFMPPPAPQPPSQSRSHGHVNAGTLPRMMPPPSRTMAHQHTNYRAADCVMINNGPHVDNPPSKTHFQDKQTHQTAGYTRHNPHHQPSFSSNSPFLHSTRHHSTHSARDTYNKHGSNPTMRQLHQQPTPEQISSHGNNVTNSSNKRGRTQNIASHGHVAAIDRNQNNASHGSTFNKRAKMEVKEEHCKGARASTSHGNARSILKKRPAGNQPPSASASASSSASAAAAAATATLISTTTSSLPNTSSDQKNTINPSLCTKQIAVEVNGSDKDNAVNHNETPPTAFVRNTSSSDQKNTINPSLFNKQISVEGNGFDKDNAVKQTETHIIFAVDFSGSMRGRKTRDLLEFIDNFLGQELAHQLLKVNKKKNSTCIVSLLVFSELATNTLATRTSLKRKDRIHSALNTAKTLIPKGHKVFTAGFKEAHRLASFHLDKKKDNNTVLIFLSDGQPCDLKHPPPLNSSIPMQSTTTYGTNKKGKNDVSQKRYPAAGHYIELMQQQEYNFNLHLVSLNNDSQKLPWMAYLAKRYKGTLHTPYLGNGSIESTFNAICASAVASHHGSSKTRNEPLGASVDERSCQQGTEPLVLRLRSGSTDDGAKQLIGSNIRGESSILGGADIVKNQHEAAASNPALLKTEEENDIAFISSVVTNSSANKTLNPKMNLDDSNISGNRKRTSVVNNHDTTLTTSQDQNRDGNNNNLTARNKRVKLDINDPEQALDTNKTDETHVIFAIDFSGSMRAKDVKTKEGRATRWEAVFECIDTFLTQQLQQQENNKEESTCFVSMLIFNEEAQTLINRVSLQKQSRDVRNVFKQAQCSHRPNGGTGFAAGFKLAYELSAADIDSNVVLVFLSDGRPGDLIPKPPSNPRIAMQTSFRHKKQDHSAAGQYIEKMQERHSNFNLQLICLFEDGKPWLDYLAKRYNGTLHSPDLTLDDDVFVPQVAPTWQREADHSGTEDEVIEIKVKSEETLINEQYKRAQTEGNVVSLTSMTTSASSIRSTFNSISATVTALRHGPSSKLQERNVSVKSESPMISYKATRMILTSDSNGTDKFSIARNEGANGRKIDVSIHPFAQGGLRNVYRMRQESISGTLLQVAKESRHAIKYQERLKFHLETVKCQEQAASYANWFNNQILRMEQEQQKKNQMHSLPSIPCIEVLRAEVYRLNAPSCPGGFRYLAVEKELGGTYLKWNNNDGYVNSSETIHCHVAQAFSHFSYERSKQKEMVVDIQGSEHLSKSGKIRILYTDPQLHSVEKVFGRADRGTNGFDKFFSTHKCNFICKGLDLTDHSTKQCFSCS